jgi:carboxylesterase type B
VDPVARTKAGRGGAPFYNCVFAFESPDPVQKAFHGTDVPFFFDNAYLAPYMYTAANKQEALRVSDTCGSAWAAFARTGDPTGRHMPRWLPYEPERRYTMMIQYNSELVSNYRAEALELAGKLAGKRLPGFGKSKGK